MSVNVIFYKDGAKMMRPVLTREEYLQLRDSDQNRRASKRQMVQMNYSAASPTPPEGDSPVDTSFPLKGCKTPSNTVGMDIDVTVPPTLSEEEQSKWLSTRLEEIKQTIIEKKDDLGLLMLEASATKGYHLVFRRHPDLTQEENLRWASDLLGVAYDHAAKDITRVFYTPPSSHLLFLDNELFSEKMWRIITKGSSIVSSPPPLTHLPRLAGESNPVVKENVEKTVKAASSSLRAFDLCVDQAGLDVEKMDVWGEHNWHSNLMAVLSVGLPKLMSKEQLMAVVRERLPRYSQYRDCHALIEYFYENYTADKGFMSAALREINAKSQSGTQTTATDDDESAMAAITQGWEPPRMPKKLPRLVDLEVRDFDPRYREALAMTAIVGHSGIASHFRARYINNKLLTPSTMVSVIGPSGSGKDYCTQLFNAQMLHTLDESDNREWEKVRKNAELREKLRNAKECPPKYHPKIRLFESASKTSLLELQTNLGENGMLVGMFSEVDGFISSAGAAWSNISVMLRKGLSGEKHRQFYMSESTCNTTTPLNISLLMEGTPKAILERMFNDKNCENGLMQRFVPVLMPKKKRTFRPPMQEFLSDTERRERDVLLMELYQKDLALGDDTLTLETPKMNKAIGQWFDSLEEQYNDGQLTEAEADLSHRCGEFMLRTAIPLIVLYGETKEVIDYSVWVGQMAFYNICCIYGHRVQQDITASEELLTIRLDFRKTAEPILSQLPNTFTLKEISDARVAVGQSADARSLLSRYVKKGKLIRVGKGIYQKVTVADK